MSETIMTVDRGVCFDNGFGIRVGDDNAGEDSGTPEEIVNGLLADNLTGACTDDEKAEAVKAISGLKIGDEETLSFRLGDGDGDQPESENSERQVHWRVTRIS